MMALSSQHVITMTYLEGPKLEDELLRRLKSLGIQSKEELRSMLQTTEEVDNAGKAMVKWNGESSAAGFGHAVADTFAAKAGYYVMSALGPALAFRLLRNGEWLYSSASRAARSGVNTAGWLAGYGDELIPAPEPAVIDSHESARELIDTLLDVHGYQIFRTELFNADPHPGNIIVMENNVLGLIDYGQCKRLAGPAVRLNIAELIVAVAEGRADADIAAAFRKVGMRTVNDNDFFIANFARLLFGHFRVEMMDRAWHLKLHAADKMIEFPVDMIMVYRVAALLRGLSLSLQYDVAIGEAWYEHAKRAIELQADLDLNRAAAAAPTPL